MREGHKPPGVRYCPYELQYVLQSVVVSRHYVAMGQDKNRTMSRVSAHDSMESMESICPRVYWHSVSTGEQVFGEHIISLYSDTSNLTSKPPIQLQKIRFV